MRYTVNFSQVVSVTVTVDADDVEQAIEAAHDEAPTGVCAQCSGWGQHWSRDDDGELNVESVYHGDDEVCVEPETWRRVPIIPMEG